VQRGIEVPAALERWTEQRDIMVHRRQRPRIHDLVSTEQLFEGGSLLRVGRSLATAIRQIQVSPPGQYGGNWAELQRGRRKSLLNDATSGFVGPVNSLISRIQRS
jgi:hypothetical protein